MNAMFEAVLWDFAQVYYKNFLSGSAGICWRLLLIYTAVPDILACRLCVCLLLLRISASITSSVREMKVCERGRPSAPVDTDTQMGR